MVINLKKKKTEKKKKTDEKHDKIRGDKSCRLSKASFPTSVIDFTRTSSFVSKRSV